MAVAIDITNTTEATWLKPGCDRHLRLEPIFD